MSAQKLLKSPVRLLLITFVVTANFTAAASPATPRISPAPAHGHSQSANARSRARQDLLFQGIERWGLNE
jgi:hypothetical protein